MGVPIGALAGGFGGYREIDIIYQRGCGEDYGFEITFKGSHENPDGCANSRTVVVGCDHAAYQTMVSITLTAIASSKPIDVWVSSCNAEDKAVVRAIRLKP